MHRHNPVVFLPLFCIACKSVGDHRPIRFVGLYLLLAYGTVCTGWHTTIPSPSLLPYFAPFRFSPVNKFVSDELITIDHNADFWLDQVVAYSQPLLINRLAAQQDLVRCIRNFDEPKEKP